jgi:predicted RNase H-like HicB family nuclease
MNFTIEHEQEVDGRWLAEVLEMPGVLAYGKTPQEAIANVQALALRAVADRIEHGEKLPEILKFSFLPAAA